MTTKEIRELYFQYLWDFIRKPKGTFFDYEVRDELIWHRGAEVLLRTLHDVDFTWTHPMDENRASDGHSMRVRFADIHNEVNREDIYKALEGPCSMFEMMIALAWKESVMFDPIIPETTDGCIDLWFEAMIFNLTYFVDDSGAFFRTKIDLEDPNFMESHEVYKLCIENTSGLISNTWPKAHTIRYLLDRWLNQGKQAADGTGGIFLVPGNPEIKNMQIWDQMHRWYHIYGECFVKRYCAYRKMMEDLTKE